MFNTYNAGDTNLEINACSGRIYKTYKESWFEYLDLYGGKAKILFNNYKDIDNYKYEIRHYKDIVVLQMILTSNKDCVIAELIKQEDFDKYFSKEVGENDRRN